MKKVLIVFNHPAPYKVRLFNELSKYFELHVIFERDKNKDRNKKFYFEEEHSFIRHHIKGFSLGNENFFSFGIKRHLKHNSYDLIIMNGYSTLAEMIAIKYLKRHNKPYVMYINGGIIKDDESSLKRKIKTMFLSGAKAYFSPDSKSSEYLTHYGANKDAIYEYPYSTIYESEINESNEKKSNEQFDKVFVSAGQLIKRKNYFNLVKEWQKYPTNYGLFLFGDGKEKEKIQAFIEENNIKNVILEGFLPRNEMLSFYKNADVFLFPSNEDIYGHVINESLSQGLPVISTNKVNSAKKLIKNEFNGFVLDSLTGDEFKNAIEYCLNNNLSNNCIETAKENTIEKMTQKHVEIIERILK